MLSFTIMFRLLYDVLRLLLVVVLVQEGQHHAAHQFHVQIENVHREQQRHDSEKRREYLPYDLHCFPSLPALGVVEVDERGVHRLLVEHRCHVVVDDLSRLCRRHRAAVHQRVRHPHDVELGVLAELLLKQALAAGHALAADVVVHDDHVAVELRRGLEHHQDVAVAADRVRAHRRARVQVRKVAHHLVAVFGVHDVVARERVHVDDRHDAPALIEPVGGVVVIRRAAAPGEGAVAVLEGLDVVLQALFKVLPDLLRLALKVLIRALLVHVDAPEALRAAVEGDVVALCVDVPLVRLVDVELIEVAHALGKGVPVELLAELLFQEPDGGVYLVHAQLLGRRVVVHKRRDEMYQDYIDGKKELREINMEFNARYVHGEDMPGRSGCGYK